ncbi:unnamed protein product [Schistocephalus solidus]|uniref:Uncharacterized protein n=1 Tax=Schistocephalus solidus TaxID=70667 RepID=A0A3P7DNM7_SCHSO|nr:unnamed protein product [Schistocephalus solidus]
MWYLMSVSVRHLNRAFGSSHSTSSAHQNWLIWLSLIQRPTPLKRAGNLTNLKLNKFDDRFARQNRSTPPPKFPLASNYVT